MRYTVTALLFSSAAASRSYLYYPSTDVWWTNETIYPQSNATTVAALSALCDATPNCIGFNAVSFDANHPCAPKSPPRKKPPLTLTLHPLNPNQTEWLVEAGLPVPCSRHRGPLARCARSAAAGAHVSVAPAAVGGSGRRHPPSGVPGLHIFAGRRRRTHPRAHRRVCALPGCIFPPRAAPTRARRRVRPPGHDRGWRRAA